MYCFKTKIDREDPDAETFAYPKVSTSRMIELFCTVHSILSLIKLWDQIQDNIEIIQSQAKLQIVAILAAANSSEISY